MSLPFPLAGLLIVFRALELASVIFFPTIYRTTYPIKFHVDLTGSYLGDDILIIIITIFVAFVLLKRNVVSYVIMSAFAGLAVSIFFYQSQPLGEVVAISGLPIVVFVYLYTKQTNSTISLTSITLSLMLLLSALCVASIVTWIGYPIFPSKIFSGPQWYASNLTSKLFYTLGLLSPVLMTLTIFSFALRPIIALMKERGKRLWWKRENNTNFKNEIAWSRRIDVILVLAACGMVILLSVYPYLPSINANFQLLSVDGQFYINQIHIIKEQGLFAKGGPIDQNSDRAVSLVVFYALSEILGQHAENVIPFLPIPLGISLVLSTYYLVRYVKPKSFAAPIAAILASVSTQFLVGFYAGFFSNMMAISFALLAILFFLRYRDGKQRRQSFLFFSVVLFLVLLIHAYTWVFLTMSLFLSIIMFALANGKVKFVSEILANAPVLMILIASAVAVFVIASIVNVSAAAHLSDLLSSSISENYFATRWFNMNYTFRLYLGGFLTHSVLILLALVWALNADYKNRFDVLILSSMFVTSLFFFFGDSVAQSRMFYNIPIYIPAAILLGRILAPTGSPAGLSIRLPFVVLVVLFSIEHALSSVANFYLQL